MKTWFHLILFVVFLFAGLILTVLIGLFISLSAQGLGLIDTNTVTEESPVLSGIIVFTSFFLAFTLVVRMCERGKEL